MFVKGIIKWVFLTDLRLPKSTPWSLQKQIECVPETINAQSNSPGLKVVVSSTVTHITAYNPLIIILPQSVVLRSLFIPRYLTAGVKRQPCLQEFAKQLIFPPLMLPMFITLRAYWNLC